MLIKSREPIQISHVYTIDDREYLIVQYKTKGFENVRYYSIHLCDLNAGLLNKEPIVELSMPFEQKNRYKDFYTDFFGILVYAVTTCKIIPGIKPKSKQLGVTFEILDKWHEQMINDYLNNDFDSMSIAYPEGIYQ